MKEEKTPYTELTEELLLEALEMMTKPLNKPQERAMVIHTAIGTWRADDTGDITFEQLQDYMNNGKPNLLK